MSWVYTEDVNFLYNFTLLDSIAGVLSKAIADAHACKHLYEEKCRENVQTSEGHKKVDCPYSSVEKKKKMK